jgi:hypothetical protein
MHDLQDLPGEVVECALLASLPGKKGEHSRGGGGRRH